MKASRIGEYFFKTIGLIIGLIFIASLAWGMGGLFGIGILLILLLFLVYTSFVAKNKNNSNNEELL